MRAKYGIDISFLKSGLKSHLAERYLRFLKSRIFEALNVSRKRRWIEVLANVVEEFNDRLVAGTTFRRRDIDRRNYSEYMKQLTGVEDLPSSYTMSSISGKSLGQFAAEVFKFPLGALVLLKRSIQRGLGARKFKKISVHGEFAPSIYRCNQDFMK